MAHRTTLEEERPQERRRRPRGPLQTFPAKTNEERERIFERLPPLGYLEATLDPLGMFEPLKQADLKELTGESSRGRSPHLLRHGGR